MVFCNELGRSKFLPGIDWRKAACHDDGINPAISELVSGIDHSLLIEFFERAAVVFNATPN
tara:strand:+ start:720 stop:902 length:183 start_codon:yes stop_codon:yes gene_type:complete